LIHTILFDHDGVLVNSMSYHVKAWQEIMSRHGIEIDPLEIYMQEGATTMEIAAELFHRHRKSASLELVQQIAREKRDSYLANNESFIYEGVLEVVEYLRENRYRLGIVTGSIRSQIEPVLGPEILGMFDCLVTGDDVEYGTPDPEPFIRATQKLNCAPSECLVIENAPLGIQAAKAAGMHVVAITTTLARYHLRQADVIVAEFDELRRSLPGIISRLEGPALQPKPQPSRPENDYFPLTDEDVGEY